MTRLILMAPVLALAVACGSSNSSLFSGGGAGGGGGTKNGGAGGSSGAGTGGSGGSGFGGAGGGTGATGGNGFGGSSGAGFGGSGGSAFGGGAGMSGAGGNGFGGTGFGGTGGSGFGGTSGAAGAPGTGEVACGGATCATSSSYCCVFVNGQTKCTDFSHSCQQDTDVYCDGPEDCPGQVCCGHRVQVQDQTGQTVTLYNTVQCEDVCNDVVFCGNDPTVCTGGTQCGPSGILPAYNVCRQ